MSMSLLDLMDRLSLLKAKLAVYGELKAHAEQVRELTNSEAVDEVLLDLDEFCVAQLKEEIDKIEKAEVEIDGKKKRAGKAKTAKPKSKAKGNRSRKKQC